MQTKRTNSIIHLLFGDDWDLVFFFSVHFISDWIFARWIALVRMKNYNVYCLLWHIDANDDIFLFLAKVHETRTSFHYLSEREEKKCIHFVLYYNPNSYSFFVVGRRCFWASSMIHRECMNKYAYSIIICCFCHSDITEACFSSRLWTGRLYSIQYTFWQCIFVILLPM